MHKQTQNILIVTTSADVFTTIREHFISKDVDLVVIQANTLSSAREIIKNSTVSVVISDYSLEDGICVDLVPVLNKVPLIVLFDEGSEEKFLPVLNGGAFSIMVRDRKNLYTESLYFFVKRSIEKTIQQIELARYRVQLETIIEERTTELIEIYEKMQENEANFRNIFQSAGDCMIITDTEMKFIEANEAFYKQFDVSREYLTSIDLIDFLMPEYKASIFDRLSMLKQGTPTGYLEIQIRSMSTGKVQSFEVNSVPIVFNQKGAILSIIRDLTERKLMARRLFETIIQTEEQERTRIARDLHDEIGPLISALKIFTTSFLESTDVEKKDTLAGQIGKIARDLIDSIKTISNDMSPHVLVNFGLVSAIKGIINLFSDDINISFSNNISEMRFPITIESVIYRIFKELINNTIKHSRSKNIYIDVDFIDSVLLCNYRDDGIGFELTQSLNSQAKGMGISNIITRIKSLGGEYEIHTSPGNGFEINFAIITNPESADAN
ncbi:MAG: PAS domain S-box protein [Bacteroidales bacterium]|nr:PAS domain S-box protein [Bacteroidales bacterium]